MAVQKDAYSTERYLAVISVIGCSGERWLTLDDIDWMAYIGSGLEPEVESLDHIGVLESYYSPADDEMKYRAPDEYAGEFRKIAGYFNTVYGGNLGLALNQFDEVDEENLSEEVSIVELLS